MRFFNAGLEVAHDGSPVPSNATPSSAPPPRPPMFSAGPLGFPTDNRDDTSTKDDGVLFGVTGSGETGGLPMFSVGGGGGGRGEMPPSTPSKPWEEKLPPDAHVDPNAAKRWGKGNMLWVLSSTKLVALCAICLIAGSSHSRLQWFLCIHDNFVAAARPSTMACPNRAALGLTPTCTATANRATLPSTMVLRCVTATSARYFQPFVGQTQRSAPWSAFWHYGLDLHQKVLRRNKY